MDANIFYELYRQREAKMERDLARRLSRQLRPEAATPRRGTIRTRWIGRRRRIGAPAGAPRRV